jgi:hypothetical protein
MANRNMFFDKKKQGPRILRTKLTAKGSVDCYALFEECNMLLASRYVGIKLCRSTSAVVIGSSCSLSGN